MSPEAYGHFTHMLTALAGGRVILSLEGGYNVNSISHAMSICTKALLGDPLPALPANQAACPSAVNSIRNVIRTHSKYWSALCFQVALPQENILPKPSALPIKIRKSDEKLSDITVQKLNQSDKELSLDVDSNKIDLNVKESDTYVTASESSIKGGSVTRTVSDITSLLEDSLSRLSINEKRLPATSSPDNANSLQLSSDSSPVSSETLSKINSPSHEKSEPSQGSISPMKLSFSDEGYKSEDLSEVFSSLKTTPLSVVDENYQEKMRSASDRNDSSRNAGEQGDAENAQAGASGSSGSASGQQTLVGYLSENMQVNYIYSHIYLSFRSLNDARKKKSNIRRITNI